MCLFVWYVIFTVTFMRASGWTFFKFQFHFLTFSLVLDRVAFASPRYHSFIPLPQVSTRGRTDEYSVCMCFMFALSSFYFMFVSLGSASKHHCGNRAAAQQTESAEVCGAKRFETTE